MTVFRDLTLSLKNLNEICMPFPAASQEPIKSEIIFHEARKIGLLGVCVLNIF